MKFKYKISPGLKLINEYYCGYFKWNDLIINTLKTRENALYKESYNVIADFTQAKVILNIKDLDDYIEEYQKYSLITNKCAIIVSSTYDTSMAMLFEIQVRIQNAKVFHSHKDAYEWLEIDPVLLEKE
ncbi:hypothetical protein BZG02_05020 [Labilibaculum filiforme]|uniref:STAS/SEC14 domain-containing protein n=1 Tax=Labilibaculum filiforme TaxID=1940526 RepID=A0A2N3I1J5_9BACT|nr:hypothetical protein [Labilibaculum filiforme]PKQ64189.1 hypothetical protein BZG02_05020 [Labilibaculum filiforme]